ncbi:MAG TPA: glutaredoxin family protein [Cellvibrio sp.]|nr:glutaredoxin family protein [Cellvibrio sp.]
MSSLILYTTAGCHLCETAKTVLWPLLTEFGLRLQQVDIAESDALIERYGIRIPVIAFEGVDAELAWPFVAEQAWDFIAEYSHG